MKPIFILAFHSLLVLLKVNAKRDDEEHGIGIPLELNEDLLNNAVIEGLIETNLLRCIHGSPPVDLDPRLLAIAKDKADMLAIEGRYNHAGGMRVGGENLWKHHFAYETEESEGGTKFVDFEYLANLLRRTPRTFYNEEPYYDYDTTNNKVGTEGNATGHFTALVWKSTKLIGLWISCGKRINFKNLPGEQEYGVTCYIAAKYYPPGNVQSFQRYIDNVKPPIKTEEECRKEIFEMSR